VVLDLLYIAVAQRTYDRSHAAFQATARAVGGHWSPPEPAVPGVASGSADAPVPGVASGRADAPVPGVASGSADAPVPGVASGTVDTPVPGVAVRDAEPAVARGAREAS
jgi:hypothetical protein